MTALTKKIALTTEIEAALDSGAALFISVSGGKDSDAMTQALVTLHRERGWTGKIYLIHADLGQSEWSVTERYLRTRAEIMKLPLHVTSRTQNDLIGQMRDRMQKRPDAPPFPSAAARYCTADQKRTPLSTLMRSLLPEGVGVCATGLRAEESSARSKKPACAIREDCTTKLKGGKRKRLIYNWNPILRYTLDDVWATLGTSKLEVGRIQAEVKTKRDAGTDAFTAVRQVLWTWHPAYALGNQRLSCSICILGSRNDIANGIEFQPNYYRELVQIERESGFSFRQDLRLETLRPDLLEVTHVTSNPALGAGEAPA